MTKKIAYTMTEARERQESYRRQPREFAARQFGMQITNAIRDYLPPRFLRDIEEVLARLAYENHFELTSMAMREEYEARGRLLLDIAQKSTTTGQFSPQHKATPHG